MNIMAGADMQDTTFVRDKRASLLLLLAAQVLAMSVWFSSAAAIADIKLTYQISPVAEALLT
ncbi:hypothetical protein, partial [Falsirhodobacter sp. alg1]